MVVPSRDGFPRAPYKYEGGWVGLAIAAVGAFTAYTGGKKAERQMDRFGNRSETLEERQIGIAERQDARAEEMFGQYRDIYMPRERAFVSEAFEGLDPNVESGRAIADVRQAGAVGEAVMERNLRRLGIDPSSPAYVGLSDERNLREAMAAAAAGTHARQRTDDVNFSRKHDALSIGRGIPGDASSMSLGAADLLGGAASAARRRAEQAGALAGGYGQAFGSALGDMADWWASG